MKRNVLFFLFALFIIGCNNKYPNLNSGLYADIETNKGSIIVSFEFEKTPVTVANFISLSEGENEMVSDDFKNKRYYDGLVFHRVIPDFMIQGGDPTATGSGGPGYTFENEIIEDLKHNRAGVLSMANAGPGTNGSQFFITHKETPWLDGLHTVFGSVVVGQNVVDSIAQNDTIKKVTIIRKGSKAKKFDAPKILTNYFKGLEAKKIEREEKQQLIRLKSQDKFEKLRAKALATSSGLKYIITEKGKGPKVVSTNKASVHYAVYFENATLLETSKLEIAQELDVVDTQRKNAQAYQPLIVDSSPKAQLIEGFKEGLRLLSEGDKATLFIPYELAYGKQDRQGIPPQSNLIFEIEIVKVLE